MNAAALCAERSLLDMDMNALQKRQEETTDAHSLEQKARIPLYSGRLVAEGPFGGEEEGDRSLPTREEDMSLAQEYASHTSVGGSYNSPSRAKRAPQIFPASNLAEPGEDGAMQLVHMQQKLQERLGPEYIASRQGPAGAGKLHYIEGWKVIDLANEVFGFNGWSSSIVRLDTDYIDEIGAQKFNIGVTAVVRVTLRDGTFHEDVGYGGIENAKTKFMGLEKAKKEAVTDATKRALRTFGRVLGNCLYDKKFVANVSNVKPQPTKFEISNLKRGPEKASDKQSEWKVRNGTAHDNVQSARQPTEANGIHPNSHAVAGSMNEPAVKRDADMSPGDRKVARQQESDARAGQHDAAEESARKERLAQAAARKAALRSRGEREAGSTGGLNTSPIQKDETTALRPPTSRALDQEKSILPSCPASPGKTLHPTAPEEDEYDDELTEMTASQVNLIHSYETTPSTASGTGCGSSANATLASNVIPALSPNRPLNVSVKRTGQDSATRVDMSSVYKRTRQT